MILVTEAQIKQGFTSGSLNNLTPTQLPVGTIIEDKTHGNFEKTSEDQWASLYDHCAECGTVIKEEGDEEPNGYPRIFLHADNYFKNFRVISVPYISTVDW